MDKPKSTPSPWHHDARLHAELELAASSGDPDAAALAENDRMIIGLAIKTLPVGDPDGYREDAIQAGRLALLKARQRYDPGRGAKLGTYAYPSIRKAILDTWLGLDDVSRNAGEIHLLSLEDGTVDPVSESSDPLRDSGTADVDPIEAAAVRTFVVCLPPKQREVVLRHFWAGESLSEIARTMGISRQAAHRLLKKALTKAEAELTHLRSTHWVRPLN